VWEHQVRLARERGDERAVAQLEATRVTLFISYEGDPPDLAAAGIDAGYDSGGMITGYLPMRDLDRVASLDGASEVTIQPTLRPLLDTSVKEIKVPWKTPAGGGWPGRGSKVIVAVIDTGIDIFHKSFLRPDGKSRILELWDQSSGLSGGGPPPSPTMPGRIYNNTQISDAITAGSFESTDSNGHGTHVAGIAAGAMTWGDRCSQPGTYAGVAPDADLVIAKVIGVQGSDVVAALSWCAQAGSRHSNKSVVINCSFGHDTGPHDATDWLDNEFDKVLRPTTGPPRGLVVVCSAGNEGEADIHESGTVQPGGSATVPFYMPNGSSQPDALDIWYDGATELGVEVIAPPSTTFPPPNTTTQLLPPSNTTKTIGGMLVAVSSTTAQPNHNNRRQINVGISAAPPATPPPTGTTPPKVDLRPGTWQLVLTHISGPAAHYDAWFATSHGDGFPRFRKPDDQPGLVARRRENTVGSPGSCRNVITVANYNDREGTLAASSSRGADNQSAVPAAERKPTIAAPGEAVASARSRLDKHKNSSCCDQLVVDKSGTSMASPHVAGVVALMLEKNAKLTFEEARAFLQGSARLDGIPTSEVPPEDPMAHIRTSALWGSGKVDARAATDVVPAPAGGGGGGGPGPNPLAPIRFASEELGYTPHTWASRMSDWRRRFDGHPGVMLLAALVSEHVDEVLWLVNHNRRAIVAWRRGGGHLLVRRLLQGVVVGPVLIPTEVDGHDMHSLLERLTAVLPQVASQRLREDVARFADFAQAWPGATIAELDAAALRVQGAS
jgi:subtilisin family serine protease